jgi:DNA primase small subunit
MTSRKSIEFLKENFNYYYKNNTIELPDRFGRREFAFLFFDGKGMMRHISFDRKKNFKTFLTERVPAHVYYSSAYYQKPDASSMEEKNWMGAELIFDLDSDHLPNAEKLSYEEQLKSVKDEFNKLIKDFLLDDFGFNEKNIELYFSGSRGYHCHVKDQKIFNLDSSERREIVDYITGRDLRDFILFREQVTNTINIKGRTIPSEKTLIMPKPTEPGWRGRISRGIIDIINEIKKSENPLEKLEKYGVKKNIAMKLITDLSDERLKRIKEGRLDQSKTIRKFFLNNALRKTAVSMSAGETDEPVTCDVKRLIRLPLSLHAKTGFKVKCITLDDLDDFNPLRDAIVFNENPIKIYLNQNISLNMKDEEFNLKRGENEVPKYLAIYLIGSRLANIS